jgi:peptide/nickel transport system ATP-binding protein
MALLTEPALLIADEPTTALDATIELQIVELLRELKQDLNGALLLVSHSLGLIAETCDDVVVLYAGRVMESGPVAAVLDRPAHPYTRALLACEIDPIAPVAPGSPLVTIPGTVPDPTSIGDGCAFASRCAHAGPRCAAAPPHRRAGEGHSFACWLDVSELAA